MRPARFRRRAARAIEPPRSPTPTIARVETRMGGTSWLIRAATVRERRRLYRSLTVAALKSPELRRHLLVDALVHLRVHQRAVILTGKDFDHRVAVQLLQRLLQKLRGAF